MARRKLGSDGISNCRLEIETYATMSPTAMDANEAFNLSYLDENDDDAPFSGLHLDTDLENNVYAPFQPSTLKMIKESLAFITASAPKPMNDNHWTLLDLGSGDGRWGIVAAQKFGFSSLGIDIDSRLVNKAKETARICGVEDRARFMDGDFGSLEELVVERAYDIVVCYLLPDSVVLPLVSGILWKHYLRGATVVSPHFDLSQLRRSGAEDSQKLDLWHRTPSGAFLYRVQISQTN